MASNLSRKQAHGATRGGSIPLFSARTGSEVSPLRRVPDESPPWKTELVVGPGSVATRCVPQGMESDSPVFRYFSLPCQVDEKNSTASSNMVPKITKGTGPMGMVLLLG